MQECFHLVPQGCCLNFVNSISQ